jgi:hypothetical protein
MESTHLYADIKARGCVDYMLRSTQQHHVQLSSMADQKAHILLGVAAIILTMILNYMKTGGWQWWLMVLGLGVLSSAVFAILAIMPSYKNKKWHKPNYLFFTSFARLDPEEYMQKMGEIIRDDARVYETIINEIYQMGQVLHFRKYRYLKFSYRLFLAGMLLCTVVWIAEQSLGR